MPNLAACLDRFQASAISQVYNLAVRLREEGRDIIDLSIGEPDFNTPDAIKLEAKAAIDEDETKYTSVDGTTALKQAIQEKFRRDNGLTYKTSQIVVDAGAKPLLARALQAMLDPGDEVIVPTPCWTSYPDMVRLYEADPILVAGREEDGFKLQPDALASAVTDKTKLFILNSPSNPTGAAYSKSELKALTDVLLNYPDIWILTDDIYEQIVFDGFRFATPAQVEPRLFERTLTVNGISKAYAMTGWRIGYAGGPDDLIAAIRKLMSQNAGSPCSISQRAAIHALTGPQDYLENWAQSYQERRNLVAESLNQTAGITCRLPEGAFYLYPNCGALLGKTTSSGERLENSGDVARYFLEQAGVAVVPGSAFHCDPNFRLSYAASVDELKEACQRISEACLALSA